MEVVMWKSWNLLSVWYKLAHMTADVWVTLHFIMSAWLLFDSVKVHVHIHTPITRYCMMDFPTPVFFFSPAL